MPNCYRVLYNPLAGNGRGESRAHQLDDILRGDQLEYMDITRVEDYFDLFRSLNLDERLLIAGGDGTLNRFVNATEGIRGEVPVWYYPAGSGNDFWKDIGQEKDGKPVEITRWLRDLPTVTVAGQTREFINGIGYGIDGYCCEVGDQMRESSDKPVDYTAIAIKGLLFHYHPTQARVKVDGEEHSYDRVWLAPTMFGRYYGGGMMPTPDQHREGADQEVSCMVLHGGGKLHTLAVFPTIFKGEHVRHEKMVSILRGHQVSIRFDRPTALQIDGETVRDVTEYTVRAAG